GVPFRWNAATGVEMLGRPSSTAIGIEVDAISDDGSTLVGCAQPATGSWITPWIWRAGQGFQFLPWAGAAWHTRVVACSTDASVIIGSIEGYQYYRPFRWNPTAGYRLLPFLAGSPSDEVRVAG